MSFASELDHGNFGDLLSRYVVEKLSGRKINKYNYDVTAQHLCAIGSILNRNEICSQALVWGSGFMSPQKTYKIMLTSIRQRLLGKFGRPTFYAVRGKKTRDILLAAGYDCPPVYGDPALVMPILYKPKLCSIKNRMGIILHGKHEEETPSFLENATKFGGVIRIPVKREYKNITDFIDEVCSCSFIVSSSLHGLIIANAYGVPAVRLTIEGHSVHPSKNDRFRQNFKFDDYLSGLNALAIDKNITEYKFPTFVLGEKEKLTENLIDEMEKSAMKPAFNWSIERLVSVFPFLQSENNKKEPPERLPRI